MAADMAEYGLDTEQIRAWDDLAVQGIQLITESFQRSGNRAIGHC